MDVKEFRTAGHQVVDLLAEYLENIRGQSPFFRTRIRSESTDSLGEPLPDSPEPFR